MRIIRIASMLVIVALLLLSPSARSQIEIVPGSAVRGEAIFSDKGRIGCHSIDGRGGTLAPDLAGRSVRLYTPDLLASVMWNHGPAMWTAIETEAPDRTPSSERHSPITMTRTLSIHGAQMLQTLRERRLEWPAFEAPK